MRALLKKFETAFPNQSSVRTFGRSEEFVVEVASDRLLDVAAWLRMEESFRLDFLETFSIAEVKNRLQFTFFLRSYTRDARLVLRTSSPLPAASEWAELPSLVRIWPQAEAFESELSPLFGVRFLEGPVSSAVKKAFGAYNGFPMRKSYTWTHEVGP